MRILDAITSIGLDPDEPHRKNIVVLNTLVAIVIPTQLSLLPALYYFREFGAEPFLWITGIMLLLQCTVLVCQALRWHTAARIFFAFSGLNNITLSTIAAGTETYAQFLMPAVMIGAFYYFPHEERRILFSMVALSILALVVLAVLPLAPLIHIPKSSLPAVRSLVIFWFSIITFGFLYYGFLIYRESEISLAKEREKAEELLRNTLPEEIVEILKENPGSIAQRLDETTILFSDIENFTSLSERLAPDELVRILDRIFSSFDEVMERFRIEKIKTIGDAYMAASGVPTPRQDHAEIMIEAAMELLKVFRDAEGFGHNLRLRIGIQTGPVVAGVIGRKKFAYDLWGDAVNTASRMESHGLPGEIQVTEAVFRKTSHRFEFTFRGNVEIKGKGPMPVYLVTGKK